ncbi:unnamed protein product [Rotaria sordida]|uniref:MACPF domain-containing protein n=1 Tax=Rotaria sordida TaxID=392033 RepID=A0A818S342_9BILA|nr:unnamed protein product [Rotaria sordida]
MISNNENVQSSDRSKFRLFDLSELDGDDYILEVINKTQTFKTPSVIQVTNINMNTRVSVESVSYTYQEFFRSYFNSYSFGISIPIGPAQISLGYHRTLSEAYQTINKYQTAIGISTDWWGMFSVQLAPVYILKFDPIFNRSLSKLVANPTTETMQMYYNQLISTFGTHYTSSIIVGGNVEMFTKVNSEYQETTSKQSISQQISIGFDFQVYKMSTTIDIGEDIGVTTEDFKKNTQIEVKFSPAVITTPQTKNKQYDIWLDRASSTPVVVNRTLLPLVDLLIEYPIEIRRHLQLTIDYYLTNGMLPTIDQLTNVEKRKKRATNDHNTLPGLDVVGCGYDIFSLKSKSCLLNITMNDNTTWLDLLNNFMTYKVPDGYFVTSTKDLLSMSDTKFFNTFKEFITDSYITNQYDSFGFLGFGASADRQEIRTRYQRFYQHKYRMAWMKQQIIWFTLAAVTFPPPRLNRIAHLSISSLPTTFDSNSTDYKKFQQFFNAYGTHIVVRADIGGMLWAEDYFESCLITKMTETWIRREITKRYWFFATSREIIDIYHKEVDKEYQQNSLSSLKVIGGFASIHPFNGYTWLPTIKDNPSPVTYVLQPIYTLLPLGAQRDALKEATFYFRSAMTNKSNLYIQRLESETSPPPLPQLKCTERRRRRKRYIQKLSFFT